MYDNINVRPVADAEQIATLVNGVWRGQYPEDPLLPAWSPDFFRWQFLDVPSDHKAICLGAFLDDELLGIYCGDIWSVRFGESVDKVTLLSCVSVVKHPARHRVSSALLAAMREWSVNEGAHHFFGFVNPEGAGKVGRRYWTTRFGYDHQFLPGPRQWQYHPERIQAAQSTSAAATCDESAAITLRRHISSSTCSEDLSFEWSDSRLTHQMSYPDLASTEVVREFDDIGLCSFYLLPAHGGGAIGFIDFLASASGGINIIRTALENAVVAMRLRHCKRIFVLGPPIHNEDTLKALGFVPCFPSYAPLIVSFDEHFPIPTAIPAHAAFYR